MADGRIDQLLWVVVCWFINKNALFTQYSGRWLCNDPDNYIGHSQSIAHTHTYIYIHTYNLPGLNFAPVRESATGNWQLASPPISRVKE